MSDKPLTLAAVTGAHGVSGEVRLKLFGEGVDALKAITSFNEGTLTQEIRSDNKGGAVALCRGEDRTAAEQLHRSSVSREALPSLDEDEFYFSDLLDLAVVTDTGDRSAASARWRISAPPISLIEKPDGKKFMVPLTRQAVPGWDERTLTIMKGSGIGSRAMSALATDLWRKLAAYEVGPRDAAFTFSQRLARENRWSPLMPRGCSPNTKGSAISRRLRASGHSLRRCRPGVVSPSHL